jgi:hypothetical protein
MKEEVIMKTKSALCLVALLALGGCGSPDMTEDESTEQAGTFRLLHQEPTDTGSVVDFYELDVQPGVLLVMESGRAVEAPPIAVNDSASVSDIFRAIRADAEVPDILLRAEAREEALLAGATGAEALPTEDYAALPAIGTEMPLAGVDTEVSPKSVTHHCGAAWFEDNVCWNGIWRQWIGQHGDLSQGKWSWASLNYGKTARKDNIRYGFGSAVCTDIGNVTFTFRIRKALKWRTSFSLNTRQGYYRKVIHKPGGNNHDYKSSVGDVTSNEYYHHCGGVCD